MQNQSKVPRFPSIVTSPRFSQTNSQFMTKSNQNFAQSQYKDENERKGYRQFQNQQQTEQFYFNSDLSQGTDIIIELTKRQQLNQKCKEQLDKFIENYYGQGNFKIILTLPARLGENQEKIQKEQYKLLKMSINQITISEEDKLFQQRIYQFKGQPENNIQPIIELIIFGFNYFPYFQSEIQKVGGQVLVNYDGVFIQIPPPLIKQVNVNDLDLFFDCTICQELENIMILQIECSSNAEALVKFNIIRNKEVQQLIEKRLNFIFHDVVILHLEMLNYQLGSKADFNLLLKHDQLYCLIQKNGNTIQESQNNLNELLKSKDIIQKHSITDSILFYDLPCGENEIQIKLNILRKQYPEIFIEISNCHALEDSSVKLQITASTFLLKDQNKSDFQQQAKNIKTEIEKIYLPYQTIQISPKQKIIWENYLQEYFQNYQSCFTVHNKGEAIEIALKTNEAKWRELQKQLDEKLKSYTCQIIKIEAQIQIIKQLRNCSYKNKLFKQVFKNLLFEFENEVNVTIKEVDDKNILFQVIVDKNNCDITKIEKILKTEFISNLNVKLYNLLYEESLKYFKLQAPELIKNNDIFVHQTNQNQALFLGLNQHLKEISQSLKILKEKYLDAWVKQEEFIVENKLIFNGLQSKYKLNEIELKLGTKIEFIKATNTSLSKIIIQGFQNEVVDLLHQLSRLENRIKQFIKINHLECSQEQIQQLSGKSLQLSQIEEQTCSYCEFQKIVSFKPQQAIIEKLTFDGKELCIVKGDITQIECEAIVYQILNDKCEFGDVGLQNHQVKNLLQMTNNDIQEFFKAQMKDKAQLIPGDLYYYKVNTNCHVNHIFNIYPPTYRQAKTLARDQKTIEQLVQNIFKLAKEKKIKQIAFPIISAEIFGFYMNVACQILLKTIIQCLFQEDCEVKQIFILENDDTRCKRVLDQLNLLVSDNPQQKTENYLKYQWQWFEQDHFEDYDDYEVNRKICKMYTQFEKGYDQQFKIFYPYSKYPGTHLIDLERQRIWDKTHNNSEQIIISIDNFGERKYYIDGKKVADDLNRYLIQQEIQGKRKFDIFYKFYEIHLTSKGHYQKNLLLGISRPIQFIPYEKPNMENVLIKNNCQLKIEKVIEASSNEVKGCISYKINLQINEKYDKILIHTANDDENMPQQKLLELLQNSTQKKQKLTKMNIKTQQSNQNLEQIFQIRSPSNRRIVLPKREPLQDKN